MQAVTSVREEPPNFILFLVHGSDGLFRDVVSGGRILAKEYRLK